MTSNHHRGWWIVAGGILTALSARADWQDYCPWVGSSYLATSCGNGACDGVSPDIETPVNCPRDCSSAKVMAYYSEDTHCDDVVRVEYPTDTASAQARIQQAIGEGRRINFGGAGHSGNQIICNDGVVIRSSQMKDIWGIESFEGGEVVRFEAGVTYWELVNYLAARGRAFDYAVTGYADITVAGALATGVHGTNAAGYSSISRLLRWIEIVQADGQVRTYSKGTTGVTNPDLWKALAANLGALGMITNLRIAVRPSFNLRMRVDTYPESALLQSGGLAALAAGCHYFVLMWYPGPYTRSLIRLCGWETTEAAVATAANTIIAPDIDPSLQGVFRTQMQLGSCYDETNWLEELTRRDFYANPLNSPLVVNPDVSPRQHVTEIVGPWHRMLTWRFAPGQVKFSQTDWEVAIPLSQFDAMVNQVNSYVKSTGLAFSVIGTFIRMDKAADDSLLGGNALGTGFAAGDRIVHFEVPAFVPWDMAPDQRDTYEQRWRDLFTLILDNYTVRPHWGKNQNWVFSYPRVLAENASRRGRFQTVINQLDPGGRFARLHLARAGFTWPSGPTFDVDGDGMNEQTEVQNGSNPDRFNGLQLRITAADPAGDCAHIDTWSELENRWSSPTHNYWVRAGWEFDSSYHNFTRSTYTWNPWPSGNGYLTWGARFSGRFNFTPIGTYCFSVDNGATGSDIVGGRNSCLNLWIDQTRRAQTGYSTAGGAGASPRTGCVSITQPGWRRLDIGSRYHDANLGRNFKMRLRYCRTTGTSCTPNLAIPQYLVEPPL
jgi:hypothetical protein